MSADQTQFFFCILFLCVVFPKLCDCEIPNKHIFSSEGEKFSKNSAVVYENILTFTPNEGLIGSVEEGKVVRKNNAEIRYQTRSINLEKANLFLLPFKNVMQKRFRRQVKGGGSPALSSGPIAEANQQDRVPRFDYSYKSPTNQSLYTTRTETYYEPRSYSLQSSNYYQPYSQNVNAQRSVTRYPSKQQSYYTDQITETPDSNKQYFVSSRPTVSRTNIPSSNAQRSYPRYPSKQQSSYPNQNTQTTESVKQFVVSSRPTDSRTYIPLNYEQSDPRYPSKQQSYYPDQNTDTPDSNKQYFLSSRPTVSRTNIPLSNAQRSDPRNSSKQPSYYPNQNTVTTDSLKQFVVSSRPTNSRTSIPMNNGQRGDLPYKQASYYPDQNTERTDNNKQYFVSSRPTVSGTKIPLNYNNNTQYIRRDNSKGYPSTRTSYPTKQYASEHNHENGNPYRNSLINYPRRNNSDYDYNQSNRNPNNQPSSQSQRPNFSKSYTDPPTKHYPIYSQTKSQNSQNINDNNRPTYN